MGKTKQKKQIVDGRSVCRYNMGKPYSFSESWKGGSGLCQIMDRKSGENLREWILENPAETGKEIPRAYPYVKETTAMTLQTYLDQKPLHEMMESATRHDWWERIDIETCLRHIDDQLGIITKRVSDDDIGKWKYLETKKEIGETILPDKKVYQDVQSVLGVLERMAGAVNLIFMEAEQEYDPLFLKSVKLSPDNLLELDIRNAYGNRRKILAEIEEISIGKDLVGVMKTKMINRNRQPVNMPMLTNLSNVFQSPEKQICISGVYEVRLAQAKTSLK